MSTIEALEINGFSQGRCATESNGSMADLLGQEVNYVAPESLPSQELVSRTVRAQPLALCQETPWQED